MPLLTCEELNAVWIVKKQLEREQRNLVDLRLMAEPSPNPLDGMPHAKPLTYKVERIAGLMIESQQLIDRLGELLAHRKFELLSKLQSLNLNELQQRVLSYHYVACFKFSEIAKLMNFTKDYIHFLHRHALKALGLSIEAMNKCKKSSDKIIFA